MKYYFKNLCLALAGSNPYLAELKDSRGKLQKAADNMAGLQNQLYSALEKWDSALKNLSKAEDQVKSLQQLTENLRERIKDKDKLIKELEKELDRK